MLKRNFLERKSAEVSNYNPHAPQAAMGAAPRESQLIIEIKCGATEGVARLFGSNDPEVNTDNEAAGITITPNGVSHDYVRNYLQSRTITISEIDVDATTAAQLSKQWTLATKDITGVAQTAPFKLRTTSGQNIDTKVEQRVNWEVGGDQEIQIPMKANETLIVGFTIVGVK